MRDLAAIMSYTKGHVQPHHSGGARNFNEEHGTPPCSMRSGHMDFRLTEEQTLIRQTARKIATEVIGPRAAELDETGI